MPWTETCILDERLAFVAACLCDEESMTALCQRHGISRKTGYKWLARWREDPERGLADRSRAPQRRPHALAGEVAEVLVALRTERPSWGPKKLRAYLAERRPDLAVPAASTIGDLLSRRGLVEPRRRVRAALPQRRPFGAVEEANDLWCIDFKGWFRTRDGARCDPLTVTDAHSRYLLACRIVEPSRAGVEPVLEGLMRAHGLPRAIRSDNGAPFAAAGSAGGLSRLSVQWLKLGIALERIEPGCPQQNGRHERMHATLKAEPRARRRRAWPSSRRALTPFGRTTTRFARTRRWSRGCRRVCTSRACEATRIVWRSPGMTPSTKCAGFARVARSSGVAGRCLCPRPWRASWWGFASLPAGTGWCASAPWILA